MRFSAWADMGTEHLGSPLSRALFHGYWSQWSEQIRPRWAGVPEVQARIWEDYPRIDASSVVMETWCDVVTISTKHPNEVEFDGDGGAF